MTLIQLNNLFEAVAAGTLGIHSYWFGWPSDRVRSRATNDDEVQGAMYPRLLFAVPEMSQNTIQNTDTYSVQLFFDDLLGYDNDGNPDHQTQLQKWRNLMNIATAWLKTLQGSLPLLRPDGVQIIGEPRFVLDSFSGQQRLITVIVTMNIATKTTCGTLLDFPGAIGSGIPWPPQDVVIGDWVKGDQEFLNTTSNVLTWTTNNLDLTTAWSFEIFQNGQRMVEAQYTVGVSTVTINPDSHWDGSNYVIVALWTV